MRYIINVNNQVKERINWSIFTDCKCITDEEALQNYKEVFSNDNLILSVGEKSYRTIHKMHEDRLIHIGLRNFDYGTIVRLPVLNLGNCAIVFLNDSMAGGAVHWNFDEGIKNYENLTWSELRKYTLPKYDIFTISQFMENRDILNKIAGKKIALDYESAGFPEQCDFKATGLSLSSKEATFYVDMRYYKDEEELKSFREIMGKFLYDNQYNIWVYNVSFEYYATYREFNQICFFNDVMALIKCDENWGSLKYVSQYYLKVASWDDDQDIFMKYLDDLFAIVPWEMGKDMYQETMKKIDEDAKLENNSGYATLMKCYSVGVDDRILRRHWGHAFACTPINIVGKYCCYDSYYTLLLSEYLSNIYQIPKDQIWESDINSLYFI